MNLILKKIITLFVTDPVVRLVMSMVLLIGGLSIVSVLPESIRVKAGIGVIVFVGLLNFRTVWGWFKEFFQ